MKYFKNIVTRYGTGRFSAETPQPLDILARRLITEKTMQPCYGITHNRLTNYYGTLRNMGVGPVQDDPSTKAILFLSGLTYAFSYFKAARSGSEFETYYSPAHRLDDGLHDSARIVLKRLMRAAHRRDVTESLALLKNQGLINEEWLRLKIAWSSDKITSVTVQKWLARNGHEEGWLRLCIATGICSLLSTERVGFVQSMMRKPFPPLIPDIDHDANMRIADLIKAFVRDHRIDLEEPWPGW